MKKLLGIVIVCVLTVFIYLKTDAQVGMFENTSMIEVKRLEHSSLYRNWATFTYKGKRVSLPYSSIAYVIEKDKNEASHIERSNENIVKR